MMDEKTEKAVIRAYVTLMKALADETRVAMLYALRDKPKDFGELRRAFGSDPDFVKHLNFLARNGLIREGKLGFELTKASRAFIELSLADVMSTAKQALEIVRMGGLNEKETKIQT